MSIIRNAMATTAVAAALIGTIAPASAAVKISYAATSNFNCGAGVCTPTAHSAVLNVTQLETMLASGNVTINTLRKIKDDFIIFNHALTWASSSTLTLNAYSGVIVNDPISVSGSGGIVISEVPGAGDVLSFDPHGDITFLDLASPLTINGNAYTLVNNISTLAAAIAANPNGYFALANSYDATPDGTYASSPIPTTTFAGNFNGLGNTISHLTAKLTTPQTFGLFANLGNPGAIEDINLDKETITGSGAGTNAGGVVGTNYGQVNEVSANVKISNVVVAGGLVAANYNSIYLCNTSGSLFTGKTQQAQAGGIVGANGPSGPIQPLVSQCYSTMSVIVGKNSYAGGLVGYEAKGGVLNSYATGSVTGDKGSYIGGLVGYAYLDSGQQTTSYSTGAVSTSDGGVAGGSIGAAGGGITSVYWDTTTSGISNPSQGAGTPFNEAGLTGLSTTQLQAGLPAGFSASYWGESASINGGLPYLIALPPQ